jgi:hypothetical protein
MSASVSSQEKQKQEKTVVKREDTSDTLNTDDLGELSLNGGFSSLFDVSLGEDLNLDEIEL